MQLLVLFIEFFDSLPGRFHPGQHNKVESIWPAVSLRNPLINYLQPFRLGRRIWQDRRATALYLHGGLLLHEFAQRRVFEVGAR
jgi:hypothetical protein